MLRKALIANAAFSLVSGLILAIFAPGLAALMDLEWPWLLRAVGVGVVLFGAFVAWTTGRLPHRRDLATLVCILDFSWVAGSAALLGVWGQNLTMAGQGLVAGVALAVASFMAAQLIALRRPAVA